MTKVSAALMRDKYWGSLIYIFNKNEGLRSMLHIKYFDMKNEVVDIKKLRRDSKHLSSSEKVMFDLALHLFNDSNEFKLSGLERLDENNMKIAFSAMRRRFC